MSVRVEILLNKFSNPYFVREKSKSVPKFQKKKKCSEKLKTKNRQKKKHKK